MSEAEIRDVIKLWHERYVELGNNDNISHVQIFENRGREMGSSNPHPHGQIWAQRHVPTLPAKEIASQEKYHDTHNSTMLLDYAKREVELEERLVYQNASFIIVVPYWAVWPYETMILPLFPRSNLGELEETEINDLAKALLVLTKSYATFFNRPNYGAPYTMGIHQNPTDGKDRPVQMHIHFEPPLLNPLKQKFAVGYERFAQLQRDITPEAAADQLRAVIESFSSTKQK